MKKIFGILIKTIIGLVIGVLVFLIFIFVYNKAKLKEEQILINNPIGQMIEIDGKNMCIYTEGEGDHTIVFLSGSGTASPILDFKPLYERLSDDFKIVVIEKFGYGFSDIVETERSFDTMLRQDREALKKVGIEGKLILCPHSMSALEAILWAQKYPDEVEAIVGLDMALPRAYEVLDLDGAFKRERISAIGRELGLVRLFYSDSSFSDGLSKEEKALYRAIGCEKAVNITVQNEGLYIKDACNEINSYPIPDVPTLLFVSNGKEVGVENWIEIQHDYVTNLSVSKVIELDCGHYVHCHDYEAIARDIKQFVY